MHHVLKKITKGTEKPCEEDTLNVKTTQYRNKWILNENTITWSICFFKKKTKVKTQEEFMDFSGRRKFRQSKTN